MQALSLMPESIYQFDPTEHLPAREGGGYPAAEVEFNTYLVTATRQGCRAGKDQDRAMLGRDKR